MEAPVSYTPLFRSPVRVRRLAADDVEAADDTRLAEATAGDAGRFGDCVERALGHVGRQPLSGSLRFSYELDIPELRAWPLAGFPYLVFYVDRKSTRLNSSH